MAINIKESQLGKKYQFVTEGGEAKIYNYSDKYLLKVFNENRDLHLKEKKVDLWLSDNFISGVVSPVDKVYIDNNFRSYILENIKDSEAISMFSKKKHVQLLKISNKDLVGLILDASIKLENIHKSGKVVGDISDNNILVKLVNNLYTSYYIDADSFGIGNFPPDAYTEMYTDPNAIDRSGNAKLSKETDMYAFAILAFKILTRIHPFNGTYEKDKNMNTIDRMKNKISVLGNHGVKIPKIVPCWNWISPDLLNNFYEIFEKDKRCYITTLLKDLYNNMLYCDIHKNFYYSKYNKCPLCDKSAKVNVMPTIVKTNTLDSKIKLYTILSNDNIEYIFDFTKYVDKDMNVIHLNSKNIWKYKKGCNVEFTSDGSHVFEVYNDKIIVYETKSKNQLSIIKRVYKSNYVAKNDAIYYIDEGMYLSKLELTKYGIAKSRMFSIYANMLIEVDKTGKFFTAVLYPKNMIIVTDNFNLNLGYDGKITEYAIKYDKVSKNWLFIYETSKGEHRTIIISNGKVIFDSKIYKYSAYPLSNICFANNTIFSPSHKKIVGINWNANIVKNFDIDIVTEDSILEFENGGFNIVTDNKIYRYGA